MNRPFTLSILVTVSALGCVDSTAVVCDTSVLPAVRVYVRDDATDAFIGSGATLILQDGAFVDSAAFPAGSPTHNTRALAVDDSYERPGTYAATVRRAGYADWQQSNIRVTQGTCHVEPVELTARLTPLP